MLLSRFICASFVIGPVWSLLGSTNLLHKRWASQLGKRDEVELLEALYPAYNLSVPVDHFHNESKYEPHSNASFGLRYWFDDRYYKPGGPVVVLQAGETSGVGRLPFLQKGIVYILTKALGGLGVILEHRYYGTSFPTEDLSNENLRFLTTQQALADEAFFARHVVFAGHEDEDLTAPGTPWLIYGGSYAGGFVSFLRKLYPDLFWGAISSSGVTVAIWDYWQYFVPIVEYGPRTCIANTRKLVNIADTILLSGSDADKAALKAAFGLPNVTYDDDFSQVITGYVYYWQDRNWDPAVASPDFDYYCGNVSADAVLWPGTEPLRGTAARLIAAGGWANESAALLAPVLNWIGFTGAASVAGCDDAAARTQDDCFGTHDSSSAVYTDRSPARSGLAWPWQFCTEWGYIQTGSGWPAGSLPVVSRLWTVEYLTQVCRLAFNRTGPADVDQINRWGGFNLTYPRLAHIGGEADPWRPASPLATRDVPTALNRSSTSSEPAIIIPGAVHHWDENGLLPNETTDVLPPGTVRDAQSQLVQIAQVWMSEWQLYCVASPEKCTKTFSFP